MTFDGQRPLAAFSPITAFCDIAVVKELLSRLVTSEATQESIMRWPSIASHAACGAMVLACASPSHAQTYVYTVDQSAPYAGGTTAVSTSITGASPTGQSFIPTMGSLNYATLDIGNFFGGGDATLRALVYSGTGTYSAGNLLGSSTQSIIAGGAGRTSVGFSFTNPIQLTPGQTYSLIVQDLTPANQGNYSGAAIYNQSEAYANGSFLFGGNPASGDAAFSEGVRTLVTAAAPEPATWSLMIFGFGIVGGVLRRQKRRGAIDRPEASAA